MGIKAALVLILSCSSGALSAADALDEYAVKAAFVYHLTRFITWPESAEPDRPFVVGVLGENLFQGHLQQMLKNKFVNGRPIVLKQWNSVSSVEPVDLLVVSSEYRRWSERILDRVSSHPVLTIGDFPDFAERGGVVAFRVYNDRVGMIINRKAAKDANLVLSAKLLAVAAAVIEK